MDKISTDRLVYLYPGLADLASELDSVLAGKHQIAIRITQGLRTWAEQDALYAQTPKVTNARGGESWHNFGMAFDVVPMKDGVPDWNGPWKTIVKEGEALGMVSGSRWQHPDQPHFQITGRFPVSPNDEVRNIYNQGGLRAVWNAAFDHKENA